MRASERHGVPLVDCELPYAYPRAVSVRLLEIPEWSDEMKHTAKPWRVDGRYVKALKNKYVCELPCGGVRHSGMDCANAHLISAAPELLEALKYIMKHRSRCFIPSPEGSWDEMAAAAIAKAEGRA